MKEAGSTRSRRVLMLAGGYCLLASLIFGQRQDTVRWNLSSDTAKAPPGSTIPLRLTAQIEEGWHLYSLTQPKPGPDGGPNPSTAVLENAALSSSRVYEPKPDRKFDPNFKLDTETYGKEAVLLLGPGVKKRATDAAPVPESED